MILEPIVGNARKMPSSRRIFINEAVLPISVVFDGKELVK